MASELDVFEKQGVGTATTLSAPGKATSATSITVGSTANFPTTTGITFAIRVVDGNGELVAGTYTEWVGTVTSGTTLAMNAVPVYGSDQVYAAGSTTQVYMPLSSYSYNKMIDGLLAEHEQLDGTHKATLITSRTEDTNPDPDADFLLTYDTSATALKKVKPSSLGIGDSWVRNSLPAVSSVTENGNRSADITFASTVASILTPGMRIRTSRTVAAPTYMGGAFNGTNHYFTKVTATSTLSTVTNNFTIMGWVQPTAYASGIIAGRSDGTAANLFALRMNSDGTVWCQIANGGAGNTRYVSTYQSLPLNKKTHVAASWASGTVVIYFDGVSVPVATAVTGGTAPTTAGTGGDFSVGRLGGFAGLYFTGYASGVGVFDAVLTAATIKSYKNQVLSGSETNCIGAWSLNNTAVNQQAAGTNDLTATNSVGYTSGTSPYCTDANGVAAGTYDWAIVTKVATTVATVQYPEGCAIPTSGGISTVDYSGVKAPFGMPVQTERWKIGQYIRITTLKTSPTITTWYNLTSATGVAGGHVLTVPIGEWNIGYAAVMGCTGSGGAESSYITLSTGVASHTDADLTASLYLQTATTLHLQSFTRNKGIGLAAATPYYLNVMADATQSDLTLYGARATSLIEAIPAYL